MSGHLDLFFPEWQGHGESPSVLGGALALREQLSRRLQFTDVDVPPFEALEVEHDVLGFRSNLRLLDGARAAIERQDPDTIFMIGGTCAAEMAPVSFLNEKYRGDLAVLWFDAHGDLNTPSSSASKHLHGMPLRILLGDGPDEIRALLFSRLSHRQVILAGSRDLDPPELAYVEQTGIARLSVADLSDGDALRRALRATGASNLYVHLDLDVLEPQDFPHLLIPTAGGVKRETLVRRLAELAEEFPIVGSSIVEYVPSGGGDPATMERLVTLLRAAPAGGGA